MGLMTVGTGLQHLIAETMAGAQQQQILAGQGVDIYVLLPIQRMAGRCVRATVSSVSLTP